MHTLGYAQLERRSNGTARVWVHNVETGTDCSVVVEDNEPDDVFGPIFQRAAEEAGIDQQVDYSASYDFADNPFDEEVILEEVR